MKKKSNLTILIGVVIVLTILFLLSIYSENYSAQKEQAVFSQPPELPAQEIEEIRQEAAPVSDINSDVIKSEPILESAAPSDADKQTKPTAESSALPHGRCKSGYTDTYRCSGNKILRETIDTYCKQAWQAWKTCEYGCANSTCIVPDGITLCQSGVTDKYQCDGQESQREYKNKACKTSWLKDQLCQYGCNKATGRCNPAP